MLKDTPNGKLDYISSISMVQDYMDKIITDPSPVRKRWNLDSIDSDRLKRVFGEVKAEFQQMNEAIPETESEEDGHLVDPLIYFM